MEKEKTPPKSGKIKKEIKKKTPVLKPKEAKKIEQVAQETFDDGAKAIEAVEDKEKKNKRYYEAVGRRKTAIARVRLLTIKPFEGDEGKIIVNNKPYKEYFSTINLQLIAEAALRRLKSLNRFEVIAKINGGGINAQAEALRHGLARTLVLFNADFRKKLKKASYLKRDPRMKERRKYGLKKARRAPQWAKR
ncbi:30S ribosomal protein S9 [Patescibacteria group bacterium]|nr:30S ribosomal protein S9 [Patescibacteria group bacterium]